MGRPGRRGRAGKRHAVLAALGLMAMAGCDGDGGFAPLAPRASASEPAAAPTGTVAERDVEAPERFRVTDAGLWDGRPSLGGVWVTHPDATEPERVVIRRTDTGASVIGALFRPQRAMPGPAFQVSSDAAMALGLTPGTPVDLDVVALRREVATGVVETGAVATGAAAVEETARAGDAARGMN